ncbi:tumor necrosis factor receptor superfamily member 14-like [Anguilla anguilla]|uniref:tumor necrosis factor receptor superfamily member 14-like n=1 Tax=Anguilla anguilla TaxID=7936 RepID=UPI0015ADA0C3|nr:tumor necrosis factor receptor superfamily member 14-like [Anguilla anguilla]
MWHFKVPLWMAYLLLLFCGLAYSCGSAEYENNGECCPMCTPGTRVYKHCTEYTSTSCVPCIQKSFVDVPSGLSHCLPCIVCDQAMGLKTERECTPTSDTVCGPLDHHYCTKTDNKGCSFAQKHTICRPGQFIIHNGWIALISLRDRTTLTNTECGYCPDKTFSNKSFSAYCKPHTHCQSLGLQEITAGTNTSDSECGPRNIPVSIIIVPVLLVSVSVVILTIIFILKRKKKNRATDQAERKRMNWTDQLEVEVAGVHENHAADGGAGPLPGGQHDNGTPKPKDRVQSDYSTRSNALVCCWRPLLWEPSMQTQ